VSNRVSALLCFTDFCCASPTCHVERWNSTLRLRPARFVHDYNRLHKINNAEYNTTGCCKYSQPKAHRDNKMWHSWALALRTYAHSTPQHCFN